jgi:hypothetical protein
VRPVNYDCLIQQVYGLRKPSGCGGNTDAEGNNNPNESRKMAMLGR